MIILSADQIHAWDAATLDEQAISSEMLMERASVAFVRALLKTQMAAHHFVVVCGIGNNGGDGYCIARLLHLKGYRTTVVVCGDMTKGSQDAQINFNRLRKLPIDIFHVTAGQRIPWFDDAVLIDAILGIGLNRPVEGWLADIISDINAMEVIRIAVDIPSGLLADAPSTGMIIRADQTFTFQVPKLAFFFEESATYLGDWQIVDIGLSKRWLNAQQSKYQYCTFDYFNHIFTARAVFSHKGTYGSSCVIAGSSGMPGAAALCAAACLQTGAGLVTLCTDNPEFEHPEIIYATRTQLARLLSEKTYQSIAIGPGLGTDIAAIDTVRKVLQSARQPIVIDADAINILAAHPELQSLIPPKSILTPHPKEWVRLAGAHTDWMQLLQQLREMAQRLHCIIVYKKAYTIVMDPSGHCTFNATGNPGMATGGSGDVLTGIITGLLAQGYSAEIAARAGVYLHGLAGDIAMQKRMGQNLVAGDLLYFLQKAYSYFIHKS